jgi:hypothetical protein
MNDYCSGCIEKLFSDKCECDPSKHRYKKHIGEVTEKVKDKKLTGVIKLKLLRGGK